MKLLFDASRDSNVGGKTGRDPRKALELRSNTLSDKLRSLIGELSKLSRELSDIYNAFKEGRLHNHLGTSPLILLFRMYNTSRFCRFLINVGNSLRLQLFKCSSHKFGGPILSLDIAFPERSNISKDLKPKETKLNESVVF